MKSALQKWGLPALTLFTFFFLLGSRSLNEPDEGRYSEIAREMIETGDWLVPHFWYLPHLDKPPMTYWLVAASMKLFGQNEWAVRLPVALGGASGVWAAFLLGCAFGGRRAGLWSALILQSSLLYFAMARMLTTDIFLTQFIVWAFYFFWRSRNELPATGKFLKWHLAGWIALAFGFLTKGPIALAIPIVAFGALLIFRRKEVSGNKILFGGFLGGIALFLALAAPWFLAVFQRVPQSGHFMILGQAAGHLLGTTIKNRPGGPLYFFGILAVGLLPWTILLGWLWRREHWRDLDAKSKDAWLLLNAWVIFTFALFSFSQAKLPAYILPIFPALAILLALRFCRSEQKKEIAPAFAWRVCLAGSLLLPAIFPLLLKFAFHETLPMWLKWQTPVFIGVICLTLWTSRKWKPQSCAALGVALMLSSFFLTVSEVPQFETDFRRNQTLKPIGLALRENFESGDAIVCWGRLPEGLPFYSGGAISAANRPYLGGMDLTQVPFAFPGNRERQGDFLLSDEKSLMQMLAGGRRVLVVAPQETIEHFQNFTPTVSLRLIARAGQWELFSTR
jgi:4-amino-4-deoxy-L-arabinose transferase-like glycosyltransferase